MVVLALLGLLCLCCNFSHWVVDLWLMIVFFVAFVLLLACLFCVNPALWFVLFCGFVALCVYVLCVDAVLLLVRVWCVPLFVLWCWLWNKSLADWCGVGCSVVDDVCFVGRLC